MLKSFYFFLLIACFFLQTENCFSQPVSSPGLKCVSVSITGDVTLNWTIPADPGGNFVDYKIYSSLSFAGPYALVTTINTYTQTSYTHVGANANSNKVYYKIQTDCNPGPILSIPLDTFSTIFLTVSGSSIAALSWNKISIHPISGSSNLYKIYREYPAGIWTLRGSTKNLSYNDVIDVCGSALNYRIEITDNTGCISVSNTATTISGIFTDKTPPKEVSIDTVSVDAATTKAIISWDQSPSPDAVAYVIYQLQGIWTPIDTVAAPATFYLNSGSNAGNISELYRIAVLDSCGNISPLGIFHKTIHLVASFDICASTASLSWNKYINWSPGVSQYEILKSANGSPFTLIATKNASDTNYIDTGLTLGTSYCYVVRATNGTKTSSSNKACFTANVTQPPKFTYNRFATVLSSTSILLKAHVDFSSSVKYYRIQRAIRASGSFAIIAPAILPSASVITYTDNSVNTTTNSYNYKIEAMDSCQHVIMTSNGDTTMHLTATIAPNLNINLAWNDYGSWLGNVDHYEVHQSVDGVWNLSPIATVGFTGKGGTYTDDVAPFFSSKGVFAYYIKAIEGSGNTFGFTDFSVSNVAVVNEYPKFYIPNSFTPNGDNINDLFIPVIGFIDSSNYSMTIFDNTGTPCFETHDPTVGWDGKKKGHPCMENVYMYLIECKASNGDDSKMSGTLSLFR